MITLEEILTAVEEDNNIGFCTICDEEVSGIEPDAYRLKCRICGAFAVYGAEELLITGVGR